MLNPKRRLLEYFVGNKNNNRLSSEKNFSLKTLVIVLKHSYPLI